MRVSVHSRRLGGEGEGEARREVQTVNDRVVRSSFCVDISIIDTTLGYIFFILLAMVSLLFCSESSKENGLDDLFVPSGCINSEAASSCGSFSVPTRPLSLMSKYLTSNAESATYPWGIGYENRSGSGEARGLRDRSMSNSNLRIMICQWINHCSKSVARNHTWS